MMQVHHEHLKRLGGDRSARKAELYERNVGLAAGKAVNERMHVVMLRAILEERSILDYVVTIDTRAAPPAVDARLASEYLSRLDIVSFPEHYSYIEREVARNRSNGDLTTFVSCICADGSLGAASEKANMSIMLGNLPASADRTWADKQKLIDAVMPPYFRAYKGDNVEAREQFLKRIAQQKCDPFLENMEKEFCDNVRDS